MTDPKVIVDTNVLVAASIIQNIAELDTEIKHEFYDQSIQLFSLFRKYHHKKIGYIVPKVRSESFHVLAKAVKSVFIPSGLTDVHRKEIFYNNSVAIMNSSDHKMRNLLRSLIRAKLIRSDVQNNLTDVKEMSSFLMDKWKKYSKKGWRIKELKTRSNPIAEEEHWTPGQKKEVVDTHKEQINRESKQLYRFQRKHPNHQDELILAETITLKQKLETPEIKYNFMIASCDSGFFSPYIGPDGISDTVTSEISTRFCITCDYPRVIFFKSGGI